MTDFLLFVFAVVGLTLIVVESSLLEPLRAKLVGPLATLVSCYLCTGFWSGLVCGWLLGLPFVASAFAGACLGQFGASILARLEN